MATLTPNDREVLNAIFNPLLPQGSLLFDDTDTAAGDEEDPSPVEENSSAKSLESAGITAAEGKEYELALELLSKSISVAPLRASGHNNRAQVLRIIGREGEALEDINNAINLSGGKGRAACQAYCQRGLLNLKENRTEDAKRDFESAVGLGSQFAKAQLVQMNPYAALCNKMLRGVFDKMQQGISTGDENEGEVEKK